MAQIDKKTATEHVKDFMDGLYDTAVELPISIGDFLARISGFRDWQENDSVIDLGNHNQTQVLLEAKILYEAFTHKASRDKIVDVLVDDVMERPAYYLGGFNMQTALAKTLTTVGIKAAYFTIMTGTKMEKPINDKYNNVKDFVNISDNDFNQLVSKSIDVVDWIDNNEDTLISIAKDLGIENISIDGEIHTIQNGNTVWDIAQKNNTTVDELIKLNPWLKDNMSDDKSWILIKPGQTIELPQSDEQRSIDSGLEYNSQQAQQIIIDPLVLDLNHNGKIDTTNANSSKAFFDMDNNGMSEITGWIDKEDGLLVYDKNNNGKIDNINELFGNENKDGYRELRELINSNGDNVIDKNDTKFKDLKIWQDLNGDGISQNNELKTLDELNITSINLNSKNTNIDDNGNNIFKTSTFTQNGQEYLSGDLELQTSNLYVDYKKAA